MISGVAAGVADHLSIRRNLVRIIFAVTAPLGIGLVLYLWLWLTVPSGDPNARPPALARLAPVLRDPKRRWPLLRLGAGLACIVLAGLIGATAAGVPLPWQWLIPTAVLLGGIAGAWGQLERADSASSRPPVSRLRLVAALVSVVLGIALLISQGRGVMSLFWAVLAGLAVLAGVALVAAPWWLRLVRALGDERAARAREAERADLAAHLHDSVLQTLAVIRAQADQPDSVRRLARAQERELRLWLYHDRPAAGQSLAAALKAVVAEVEDQAGPPIGVVIVGDAHPTPALEAMVGATREALFNAARHGGEPISLYAEVSPSAVTVFVRDRGPGFDLESIPPDRFGVRESILGRVRRQGGVASVVSKPGQGTEVRLTLPIQPEPGIG